MLRIKQSTYVYQASQAVGQPVKTNGSQSTRRQDQVEKSINTKDFQELIEKAKNSSIDRENKIAKLKADYQAGTYDLSTESIAQAMINEGF